MGWDGMGWVKKGRSERPCPGGGGIGTPGAARLPPLEQRYRHGRLEVWPRDATARGGGHQQIWRGDLSAREVGKAIRTPWLLGAGYNERGYNKERAYGAGRPPLVFRLMFRPVARMMSVDTAETPWL